MLIDTHAHLNFSVFDEDRDEVIKNCLKNNIWMINIGTNFETSKKAVEISGKCERGVYAAIGLHPINLNLRLKLKNEEPKFKIKNLENILEEDFDYKKYKDLAGSKKVVAIGEIGLDYYYKPKTKKKLEIFKEKQRTVLCQQLKLAQELNVPVILHCRFAHDDLIKILQNLQKTALCKPRGVVHCFTGDREQAQKYLKMGFYLGFNGIIFKKIEGINFEEILRNIPLDKILAETDCPYLTPPNFLKQKNNPFGVESVAREIAELKKISFEEITKTTTKNARRFFKI